MKCIKCYFVVGNYVCGGEITNDQYERMTSIMLENAKIIRKKPRDSKGRFVKR